MEHPLIPIIGGVAAFIGLFWLSFAEVRESRQAAKREKITRRVIGN